MTARPQRARRHGDASRLTRWRQGWALALRLARRDIGRHRGRSALILILVVAPVLLIGALATGLSIGDVTVEESLPVRLGAAQAEITPSQSGQIEQLPDGLNPNPTGADALPFGDHRDGEPWTTAQLGALTGGRILTVEYPTLFATDGERLTRLRTLATPAADLADSGLARLTGGRWPRTADDVLVTEQGLRKGLPADGALSLRLADGTTDEPVRVVGTAAARDSEFRAFDVVTVDRTTTDGGGDGGAWLLLRDRPVSWTEVRDWNGYGLVVISRAVVEDPPPRREQPPELVRAQDLNQGSYVAFLVLVTVGLLIETTLLAGPAFAVSAVRRRRTLAQVAANGADQAQLRRTVLAEALLLGAAGAVAGAVLGAVGGWLFLTVYSRLEPHASPGPLDVPWPALLLLVVAATGAALVAAFVPARGASRIAIAEVLAGRERSRPVAPLAPAVGTALVLGAAATMATTVVVGDAGVLLWLRAIAAGVLVIGVLLLVPALLGALGRLAPRLPLTLRLPIRDATRQRARSASAVAAVVATVATLTILAVANASDDAHLRTTYASDRAPGHGYLTPERTDAPATATVTEIRRQHPDWRVIERFGLGRYVDGGTNAESEVVAVVPPGCTPEVSLGIGEVSEADYDRCVGRSADGVYGSMQAVSRDVVAGSTAPGRVREALARGAVVLQDARPVVDGRITVAVGRTTGSPSDRVERTFEVDAVVATRAELYAAAQLQPSDAAANPNGYTSSSSLGTLTGLLTTETAAALKLPTQLGYLEVVDPSGPISERDEAALNERVLNQISVERGYESSLGPLLTGLIGLAGALVLVAALVATALAQAEGRADTATLAALGGPPGLRRRLAAGQALVVAGLGSILGLAAGLLPGIAMALAFTTDGVDPNTGEPYAGSGLVVVPWLPLVAVVVGVTLLAALLAATTVRRSPSLTRRLT